MDAIMSMAAADWELQWSNKLIASPPSFQLIAQPLRMFSLSFYLYLITQHLAACPSDLVINASISSSMTADNIPCLRILVHCRTYAAASDTITAPDARHQIGGPRAAIAKKKAPANSPSFLASLAASLGLN
jgi:hypothetical protein